MELLDKIIPHVSPEDSRGVRQIVLCDDDYHEHKGGSRVRGRYLQVKGTNLADVEIYLGTFSTIPEPLKHEPIFLTYQLAIILMHELYHHSIQNQHRRKQPSFRKEEDDATHWAETQATTILYKIFPLSDFKSDHERISNLNKLAGR